MHSPAINRLTETLNRSPELQARLRELGAGENVNVASLVAFSEEAGAPVSVEEWQAFVTASTPRAATALTTSELPDTVLDGVAGGGVLDDVESFVLKAFVALIGKPSSQRD